MSLAPSACRASLLLLLAGACARRPVSTEWQVSIRGYGPIEAGMTLAEADSAGGRHFDLRSAGNEGCAIVPFAGDSTHGISVLVENGRIGRVDVLDSMVATNHGARVGDTEARVESLYPGRVTVLPHKYDSDGHYLVVAPQQAGDSGFALVFETHGGRVTRYRAGRQPAVEYVEGCS
jgi:hypothetical protein